MISITLMMFAGLYSIAHLTVMTIVKYKVVVSIITILVLLVFNVGGFAL